MTRKYAIFFAVSTRIILFASVCLLCAMKVSRAQTTAPNERVVDSTVAAVNHRVITASALAVELVVQRIDNPSSQIQRQVLEALIERELMRQEAEKWGIGLMRWQGRLEQEVDAVRKEFPADDQFRWYLEARGFSLEELKEWLMDFLTVEEFIIRRWETPFVRLVGEAQIDEDSRQYYERHQWEFVELTYDYVIVLIKPDSSLQEQNDAKQEAATIASRLRTGVALNDIRPDDTRGTLIVGQTPERRMANTRVTSAIIEWDVGQVSQPLLTDGGYLVAKLRNKRQLTYPEVSETIRTRILREKVETQIETWLDRQKQKADIRILDSALVEVR